MANDDPRLRDSRRDGLYEHVDRSDDLEPLERVDPSALHPSRRGLRHHPLSVSAAIVLGVLTVSAIFARAAEAGPAAPIDVELTQPNGVSFTAHGYGDEWANGYESSRGYTVVLDGASGFWEYAAEAPSGDLVPTGRRVAIDPPNGLPKHARGDEGGPVGAAPAGATPAQSTPNVGTQKALILLVQFTDQPSVGTTATQWNARYFAASSSVADYYADVSYGKFALAPGAETHGTGNDGVVGWLSLNRTHPNTAGNTGSANQLLTRDALVAADAFVNFASYDTDGNGAVTTNELHVVVVAAGYEASWDSSCGRSVWGHQWSLTDAQAPTLDGVTVARGSQGGRFMQFGESDCGSLATMGIMVHELGHDLGLPDLYDTDGSSEGVGRWSIMSTGSWNTVSGAPAGSVPAEPDAFSRWYEGWVTPQQVIGTQSGVSIAQVETNQAVYQLGSNPGGVDWTWYQSTGTGEYFLLENRQLVNYDAGLPGCGLLIWHIDETRTSNNSTNANEARKLVDLAEADSLDDLDFGADRGDAGDPYPGSSGNRSFGDATYPNSKLYSGAASGVSVLNISTACGATMTADLTAPSNVTGPANNDFANAQVLSGSTPSRAGDTNVGATKQTGEPNHAGNAGGASIWYRWTAPVAGPVTVDTLGSSFDTLLAVYRGSSVGSLTLVAANDNAADPTSSLTFNATAGTVYRIAVDGFNGGTGPASGTVTLHLSQGSVGGCTPSVAISAADFAFTPKAATVQQGSCATWNFSGAGNHSATDTKQLGPSSTPLFDSGARAPGSSYSFRFVGAGTYPYRSTVGTDPTSMSGSIKVPLKASATTGGVSSSITITWSSATVAGFRSDVQYRFKPPGGAYGAWTNWRVDQTGTSAAFVPSSLHGVGTYQFRGRYENGSTLKASNYSAAITVTIS